MSIEIHIGAADTNDIVVKNKSVSRDHAVVKIKKKGLYYIIDQDSRNGIFVNNRRVKSARIQNSDAITIGKYQLENEELFGMIKAKEIANRKDFTEEFAEIFTDFENYEVLKNKIVRRSPGPIILRFSLVLIIILILLLKPDLFNDTVRYALIVLAGVVPALFTVFRNDQKKNSKALGLLRLDYYEKLKCPKCSISLIDQNLAFLKGKGSCINKRCDAIFDPQRIEKPPRT